MSIKRKFRVLFLSAFMVTLLFICDRVYASEWLQVNVSNPEEFTKEIRDQLIKQDITFKVNSIYVEMQRSYEYLPNGVVIVQDYVDNGDKQVLTAINLSKLKYKIYYKEKGTRGWTRIKKKNSPTEYAEYFTKQSIGNKILKSAEEVNDMDTRKLGVKNKILNDVLNFYSGDIDFKKVKSDIVGKYVKANKETYTIVFKRTANERYSLSGIIVRDGDGKFKSFHKLLIQ